MLCQTGTPCEPFFTHLGDDDDRICRYGSRMNSESGDSDYETFNGGKMQILRSAAISARVCVCFCASSCAQTMKEGGRGGGAHYCITDDTDTPTCRKS
jgi:hypothetical protein